MIAFNVKSAICQLYHGMNKFILMRWWWYLLCIRPTWLFEFVHCLLIETRICS